MPILTKNATFAISSATTTHVITGVTGFSIGIVGYISLASGTNAITIQDTAASPVKWIDSLPYVATSNLVVGQAPYNSGGGGQSAWFVGTPDKGIDIVSTGTGAVSGSICYFLIPVSK